MIMYNIAFLLVFKTLWGPIYYVTLLIFLLCTDVHVDQPDYLPPPDTLVPLR